jgi:hypothetical protein
MQHSKKNFCEHKFLIMIHLNSNESLYSGIFSQKYFFIDGTSVESKMRIVGCLDLPILKSQGQLLKIHLLKS